MSGAGWPCAALLAALALIAGAQARAQDAPPGRDVDRLRLRLAPGPPEPPARPGVAQDLRDARRRADERSDVGAGHDRAEIRRLERGLDAGEGAAPAISGRRPPPRGTRLIDKSIPEVDLDLEDLKGAEDGAQ